MEMITSYNLKLGKRLKSEVLHEKDYHLSTTLMLMEPYLIKSLPDSRDYTINKVWNDMTKSMKSTKNKYFCIHSDDEDQSLWIRISDSRKEEEIDSLNL